MRGVLKIVLISCCLLIINASLVSADDSCFSADIESFSFTANNGTPAHSDINHSFSTGNFTESFNNGTNYWESNVGNYSLEDNVYRLILPQVATQTKDSDSFSSIGGSGCFESAPTEFSFSAKVSNFQDMSQAQYTYSLILQFGSWDEDMLSCDVSASWFTGRSKGKLYTNALILGGSVDRNSTNYEVELPYIIVSNDYDPQTTTIELKIESTQEGQKFSCYYRLNEAGDWQLIGSIDIPENEGTLYGWFDCDTIDLHPTVEIESDYLPSGSSIPWVNALLFDQ